jgi:hypothetical protein
VSRSLRAIKDLNLPRLREEDLKGSQAFDHAHGPLASAALPEPRFTNRGRRGSWQLLSEEKAAEWKQLGTPTVGEPAEVADAREALGQDVL